MKKYLFAFFVLYPVNRINQWESYNSNERYRGKCIYR